MPKLDFEPQDFREFLKSDLADRCRRNPKYSVRAYAKALGVENSWLSKILRQKRAVTPSFVERVGQRLGLPIEKIESFKASGGPVVQPLQHLRREQFQRLEQDTFEIIADWYHFAILELMKVKDFQPTVKWISKSLGISRIETQNALERLQRVGLLRIENDGSLVDTAKGFTTHNLGINRTSYAHRKFQEQILVKAQHALHNVPIELRDNSTIMMATNPDKIEKAKVMMDEFRYRIAAFLEDTDEKTAVYQIAVAFFPLSENEK